jgi:signal transduction histidine kinase
VVLARSAGRVLTRDQIMDALQGPPAGSLRPQHRRAHRRIRAVIEDDAKAPKRVLTVRGSGLRLRAQAGRGRPGDGERMRSLYLRIYLTVVAVLALFALASGWLVHRHLDHVERVQPAAVAPSTIACPPWAELLRLRCPGLRRAARRDAAGGLAPLVVSNCVLPLALEAADRAPAWPPPSQRYATPRGGRCGRGALRACAPRRPAPAGAAALRAGWRSGDPQDPPGSRARRPPPLPPYLLGTGVPALIVLGLMLFAAVAFAAWPVARKLTGRLEALKRGVEQFGAGQLSQRVPVEGRDEVAQLAASFNNAATRIEQLVSSHRSLLANASHELRSPLARLKHGAGDAWRGAGRPRRLDGEVERNLKELDALIDEVLLASRLDAGAQPLTRQPLDLVGLCAELAAQQGVELGDMPREALVQADDRLLRRALRNLLENALRYGRDGQRLELTATLAGWELRVLDHGPGIPLALRQRIFEPFFRLPGHAEMAGGVGLGLALVAQIASAHGGTVRVEERPGGGSVFVLSLPSRCACRWRRQALGAHDLPHHAHQQHHRHGQAGRADATQKPGAPCSEAGTRAASQVEGQHVAPAQTHAPQRTGRRRSTSARW